MHKEPSLGSRIDSFSPEAKALLLKMVSARTESASGRFLDSENFRRFVGHPGASEIFDKEGQLLPCVTAEVIRLYVAFSGTTNPQDRPIPLGR